MGSIPFSFQDQQSYTCIMKVRCRIAERFAPEYDVEKIYEELHAVSVV